MCVHLCVHTFYWPLSQEETTLCSPNWEVSLSLVGDGEGTPLSHDDLELRTH